MNRIIIGLIAAIFCMSCGSKKVDLVVFNAKIYTVDSAFTIVEAMAIDGKKIIAVGTSADITKKYNGTKKIDAQGKAIFPGFIDAHAHFLGYGLQLKTVDLLDTKSWEDVVTRVEKFKADNKLTDGAWITGRGWDQNDWAAKNFPTNEMLNQKFPNNPILLTRIDGHAAIVNQKAIEIAQLKVGQTITGGTVQSLNGKLTGVLIDNAVDLVSAVIPKPTDADKTAALIAAQKNCFAVGLTTVDDCGIDFEDVQLIQKLHADGKLDMKIYAMLSDAKKNYDFLLKNGKINTEMLNVNGFKVYGDGALGSRGACLLNPYHDRPNEQGFLLSSISHFDSIAQLLIANKMQMNTHAIGDSANRAILNIYAKYLKGKNDLRWRIEHAQVVSATDMALFGKYNIVPSVQPTHATSDMYWAADRLGKERIATAYSYKQLLQQNGWLPLGTDFPVEDISPFKTFYAAVIRKDYKNFPANGFQMENALTREEALRGMTIWAAKSNFEDNVKGSLEVGKYADFIILENDLMTLNDAKLLANSVTHTFVSGKEVYKK